MMPEPLPAPDDATTADSFNPQDALLGWMQEIAPYGIFITDAELRIRSWNGWLVRHSGVPAARVIGQPLLEAFPELRTRRLEDHFRRALAGEVSILSTALHKYLLPFPVSGRAADAPYMLQTVRIAPVPAGEIVIGTIAIIEDVTQRESQALRLQQQQERDRVLSSALAILLKSTEPLRDIATVCGQVMQPFGLEAFFNHVFDREAGDLRLNAARGITARQRDALAVIPLSAGFCGTCARQRQMLIAPHLQARTDPESLVVRRLGLRSYCGFPLLVADQLLGTLSFGSYTRDTLEPEEIECLAAVAQYVAIALDRVEREKALGRAQHALAEHAGQLETKVAERTVRLNDTIARLESFTYTVAHDLRAPIRSFRGYCEILRSDYALPDDARAILERLLRASNRLDALTRDLLEFSRIPRESIELGVEDVGEVIHDLRLLMPNLDQYLVVAGPLEKVRAQRSLLQQCLSNLFDNALKFVAKGTTPRVVLRTERRPAPADSAQPGLRAAGVVRIWVEDNGLGIAPAAHARIFEIFVRVGGMEHIEGTGVGLAIVARAVAQMGGTCGVESAPGHGSRFWIELAAA